MLLPNEIEFIIRQNDKGGNAKRPDYRGEVKLFGKVYEVAGWERTIQGTSRKMVSGKLTLKAEKAPEATSQPDPQPGSDFPPAPHANQEEPPPF